MKNRAAHIAVVALIAALIGCGVLLLISPGGLVVNMPKRGQVIDSAGNGIPGVSVISSARYSAEGPLGRSVTEYPYRVIAQTDGSGRYTLPATFQHFRVRFPGTVATEVWLVTAFKPGYVIMVDRTNFAEFNRHGDFKRRPASTSLAPSYSWRGPVAIARSSSRRLPDAMWC